MFDEESEANAMRDSLSAIASEIQKLHEKPASKNDYNYAEILNKIIKYKCDIHVKNLQIKHLRSNLKTACAVAKTISSAKASEIATLSSHLENARNQYLNLEKQQSEKNQIINNLSNENQALRDLLEFFGNAIQLCYQQLQGIRNERAENVSPLEQLKYIIVCCGKYHADHSSDQDKCIRLQQKNKFLNTKMIIMENHLEATRDELRNLRTCIKPFKDKREAITRAPNCIGVVCSEYKLGSHHQNIANLTMTQIQLSKCSSLASIRELDVTNHIKTVKKLLDEHDNLIDDLKDLSKEINVDKTFWAIFFLS
ncbi:hypothetical protein PYW08_015374 [Mythimna loreyi]|uniref:Uncharacterized protein n=1 Tax=Mythimna loreyi TaxID=667449 RepID=A0ACC2QWL6_9NEOP|nr:hypothetical protein PYW08_015374 [Mythimna loreyi]